MTSTMLHKHKIQEGTTISMNDVESELLSRLNALGLFLGEGYIYIANCSSGQLQEMSLNYILCMAIII